MALHLNVVSGRECLAGAPASVVVDKRSSFVIGRNANAHWRLVDPARQISGKHCEIVFDGSHYVLNDLSTNGTFLNGSTVRVEGKPLIGDGTRIEVGPFSVLVTLVSDLPAIEDSPVANPIAQSASISHVEPTAPTPLQHAALRPAIVRSGDPAAMVQAAQMGATSSAQAPISELIAPKTTDDLTKIQLAPKAAPAKALAFAPPPAPALVPTPALASVQAEPAIDNASASTDLLERMARGLGVPASSLAGQDPGDLAEILGRLVKDTAAHLKQQLDTKAIDLRRLKSPLRASRRRIDTNPLKSSPLPQALALMLSSGAGANDNAPAVFARCFDEIVKHKRQLDAAAAQAQDKLANELAPATLEAAFRDMGVDSDTPAGRERLWDLYRHYWQDLAEDWPSGLREALLSYQAEALATGNTP